MGFILRTVNGILPVPEVAAEVYEWFWLLDKEHTPGRVPGCNRGGGSQGRGPTTGNLRLWVRVNPNPNVRVGSTATSTPDSRSCFLLLQLGSRILRLIGSFRRCLAALADRRCVGFRLKGSGSKPSVSSRMRSRNASTWMPSPTVRWWVRVPGDSSGGLPWHCCRKPSAAGCT